VRRALALAVLAGALAACSSPEATRQRAGGPGADVGNRSEVVRMHEGSRPYHDTPSLLHHAGQDVGMGRVARDVGRGRGEEAAASPR
jgi:hypothetical protein